MLPPLYASQTVHSDNRITFRVRAPDASAVSIEFAKPEGAERGERVYQLTKGGDGVWSVTTDPAQPGFHYYEVVVDGFKAADPSSPAYFGWGYWCSGIEVPDPAFAEQQPQAVPHGEVRMHWYHSQITGRIRRCLVYTPAGYGSDPARRYPVLYLQHGSGEGEFSWLGQGRVNFILDNLIFSGRSREMLVVMDNGYAPAPGAELAARERNLFADVVVRELVPEIDRSFHTIANRENRAIAGLSMGAGQAMHIAFANLGTFASVGALSGGARGFDPATSFGGVFADSAGANARIRLFWIGCGRQDGGFAGARTLHEGLEAHGIRHTWFECDGSHDWGVWRRHLVELAGHLFRP